MFAFAILDGDSLFLARDRLGIKPLYYAFNKSARRFVFASEIKVILQHYGRKPELCMQTFADSVVLGHAVHDQTFFDGVKSLPAGHTMAVFTADQIEVGLPTPYFSRETVRDENISLTDAMDELEAALQDGVETHLVADVEVGLTLSGGIDSTLLALLARASHEGPLATFTIADHERHPDVVQARNIASMIQAEHHEVIMTFEDYLSAIPGLVATEGQPSSLYGLPYHFLCSRIARRLKACLHGEGADELFGGYREYLQRERRVLYYRERLPLLKQLGIAPSERAASQMVKLSAAGSFDDYLEQIFEANLGDPLQRHHLDLVDRCSMAVGLEMRVPYMDDRVFQVATRLPIRLLVQVDLGIRKYILRHLALRRFGPDIIDIILREKLGAPSAGIIFLDRFDQMCNELLPDHYIEHHEFGCFFRSKRELILFDLFLEVFLHHRGDATEFPSITEFIRERARGASLQIPVGA